MTDQASNILAPKDPDTPATYSIDWRQELIGELQRETDYILGAIVRPHIGRGYLLECSVAGRTERYYPSLPRAGVLNAAFRDGTAEWITKHPDAVSVTTISSAVWTVPAGITKDSQSESGPFTHVTLSGGTDGEDYELTCRMTPSAGNAQDRTIVVPVRSL